MLNIPGQKGKPNVRLGQEISLIVKGEGKRRGKRKVKSEVIFKSEYILVVKHEKYKTSVCMVDFVSGHALMCG